MAGDNVVHLTPEGRDRLEEELRDLVENRRPVIVQRVATARAEGDLSENFAYHDARQELGLLDGRVQTIQATLRNAQVLETTVGEVVGLGSTVTIRDEFGESTYVIVGPVEADVAGGRISMVSPLGAALMGRTVGDEVSFASPGGTRSAIIAAVR
ncbi:MAG: transcription elongation factor GreA [Candidatus Dormibacteraeota bacterium]|uniref:Transcription elongation factor GreA n=1 Tax=Candidatus Aeolococcus gillhamiae TaxID=3127015 RepID=A0A2W5ZF97_9BACT|nr:transcription elongation factor GreA [Candidatus Dormibacteraeota bacterium]PZR84139.1 MAG: transcription elongation factor GreA [Candidatus Dormibacter sp. RRmetagenome_bin12]